MKTEIFSYKNFLLVSVSVAALVFGAAVFGQTQSPAAPPAASDIPQELVPLAQELGCKSKTECAATFESNFEKGLELAEKYKVYDIDPTKKQLVQTYKQEVLIKLQNIKEEDFEKQIIEIANSILKNKPTLARQLSIDRNTILAAETIVTEVKNAGVTLDVCSRPANSLAKEQLLSCLNVGQKLAERPEIVKAYIPEARLERTDFSSAVIKLEEALARGEYRELGATADELGAKCLRPDSPAACDEIAQKFFGAEGVGELSRARFQVGQVKDYYKKGAESFTFVTPDGQTLTGKDSIRNTCDRAFSTGNIALAKVCGDFAVKNGFATREEVEDGIAILQSFSQKGAAVQFDECRRNPQSCEQYLPEARRSEFSVMRQIDEIMRAEIGFDPRRCEEGAFNPEIGQKCLEGSKRAIPRLESISAGSPSAQRIIEGIKGHIAEGERFAERRPEFEQVFQGQGGPGGCRSADECFKYCSDPNHGAECIAFGTKQQIFGGEEAVNRFERFNERIQYQPYPSQPYPGQPPQQTPVGPVYYPPPPYGGNQGFGPGPSPECFAAIQAGDFAKAKTVCYIPPTTYYPPSPQPPSQYPTPPQYDSPYGPLPGINEELCRTKSNEGYIWNQQYGCFRPAICPAVVIPACPTGQRHPESRPWECPRSECIPETSLPVPQPCPALPTVESCPSDQTRVISFSSPECGTYYKCQSISQPPTPYPQECDSGLIAILGSGCHRMYTDSYGNPIFCDGPMSKSAKRGDTVTQPGCQSQGGIYPPPPSGQKEQIWNSLGLRSWVRSDADPARITELKAACANTPSGSNIWLPQAGDYASRDFGMPDSNKCRAAASCAAGQYWNGTSCASSSPQTCPGGQYWYQPPDGTSGYCKSTFTQQCDWTTQYLKTSNNTCQPKSNCTDPANSEYNTIECQRIRSGTGYSTSTYSGGCTSELTSLLGSACHNMGNAWFNGEMTRYVFPGTSVVKDCREAYISSCTTGGGTSTSTVPSTDCSLELKSLLGDGCHQMYTDTSGNIIFCDGPMTKSAKRGDTTTTTGCTSPGGSSGTACPSGQYWNGSACTSTGSTCPSGQYWYVPPGSTAGSCVSSTSGGTTCPSGQYWNGTACVTSTYTSQCPSFAHEMAGYCMLNNDTSKCAEYSNASSESNYNSAVCTARTQTQSCPSGQYWNGTTCVTTCPSGQYWNGSSCVSSTTTTCPSDQYWNGASCVSSTTTMCPSGQYWSGTACVTSSPTPDPATSCTQSGGTWDGTACQFPPPPTSFLNPQHLLAEMFTIVNNFAKIFQILLGR